MSGASDEDSTRAAWQAELERFRARVEAGVRVLGEQAEPPAGASARDPHWRRDAVTLYRYRPLAEPDGTAVLIVYALVNRPYVLDLRPERSLIRRLLERGTDVWLLDWGDPGPADRDRSLADYVLGDLDEAVGTVAAARGGAAVDLLGVCQGGVLSLCYATLRPARVARLVTTVTPVDFHTPEDRLSLSARDLDVAALADAFGNVPGSMLTMGFLMLRPFGLGMGKYLDLAQRMDSGAALEDFLQMERWIFDSPAQPGRMFREFVQQCYQRNALVAGELELGAERVDLSRLTMPVLNIYARDDHLVPPAASQALARHVPSGAYSALECPGGHIGIYVGGRAQALVPAAVHDWLRRPVA